MVSKDGGLRRAERLHCLGFVRRPGAEAALGKHWPGSGDILYQHWPVPAICHRQPPTARPGAAGEPELRGLGAPASLVP